MQVQFIGVGEAFDERYANTSVLVTVPGPDGPTHVLLDCGFTAAAAYYRHANVGAALDAVWVSHFHGDHFLGLPLLLLRFWDEGRTRPLTLVGPAGIEAKLWQALELAYPGFRARLQYPVVCVEAAPGGSLRSVAPLGPVPRATTARTRPVWPFGWTRVAYPCSTAATAGPPRPPRPWPAARTCLSTRPTAWMRTPRATAGWPPAWNWPGRAGPGDWPWCISAGRYAGRTRPRSAPCSPGNWARAACCPNRATWSCSPEPASAPIIHPSTTKEKQHGADHHLRKKGLTLHGPRPGGASRSRVPRCQGRPLPS